MKALLAGLLVVVACSGGNDDDEASRRRPKPTSTSHPTTVTGEPAHRGSFDTLIPRPVEVARSSGEFLLDDDTAILVEAEAGADTPADLLRGYLAPATGLELPVVDADEDDGDTAAPIVFTAASPDDLGAEGYALSIESDRVEIAAAPGSAGFGWAVQTLRQLLPPEIESGRPQTGSWTLPAGTVRDQPRFGWRGAMLDVARHFFGPSEVERVIDLLAQYKMNRLHLHLTDDQGWRLQIQSHPELTETGAKTEVGGGEGGFYTQDEYRTLVDYAAHRGIVVVPEIDLPGHTGAALASIPALSCDRDPPRLTVEYSDGSTSLCVADEASYSFVNDVVTELAALTPGPYIHLGGDESFATEPGDYQQFMARAGDIVRSHGKQPVGWDEFGTTAVGSPAVVQHWSDSGNTLAGAAQGAGIVMSPADKAYLDMKYDASTELGLKWAGFSDTRDAYQWDPASVVPGIAANQLLGLEAPLWSETVASLADVELMLLPRLPGHAELGWSPAEGRGWDEYRVRLAAQAARWNAAGRAFTPDPVVDWP